MQCYDEKMSRKSSSSSQKDRNKKSDVKPQDKLSGKQRSWKTWKSEFEAFLAALRGENDIPLSYVIRDEEEITEEDLAKLKGPAKEVYDAPLQGTYFEIDNYQVFQHLRSQIVGSSAETHLETFTTTGDGRSAWLFLKMKYEGEDARNAAIAMARKEISSATWEKNIKNWTFDDYCLRHTRANNALLKYGVPVDGPSQVRAFLDGIHNHHMDSIKSNVMFIDDTKNDLGKAIIKFKDTSAALNIVSSGRNSNNDDYRRIGSASRGRNPGRGGNRDGKGQHGYKRPYEGSSNYRGGRGGRGRGKFQGRGRSEQPDDGLKMDKNILDQMSPKQRAAFYKGRDAIRAGDEPQTSSSRNIASATTNPAPVDSPNRDEISAVTDVPYSAASTSFGRAGNRSLQGGQNANQRTQGAISSGYRFVSSARRQQPNIALDYDKRARAEIDSRADTVCAGATFLALEESNHFCGVNGFHSDMAPIKDVPVATVATAYDDPITQETYILVFHEALYFGSSMEHSLISPMQLRHFGLRVDQTPKQYDRESLHGIAFPDQEDHQLVIPFQLHGCISYFPSRLPTQTELD